MEQNEQNMRNSAINLQTELTQENNLAAIMTAKSPTDEINPAIVEQSVTQPVLEPPAKKKKKGILIAAIVLTSILLIGGFCVWFFILRTPDVESITLSKTNVFLASDGEQQLTYTVLPEKAGSRTVVWTSSDERIASVTDDGNIIAHSGGTCVITATIGNRSASVSVEVSKANSTEKMIVGKWNGLTILANGDTFPFSGWIELNDDLTGTIKLADYTGSFSWSFRKLDSENYYFSTSDKTIGELVLSDNLLVLVVSSDYGVIFER